MNLKTQRKEQILIFLLLLSCLWIYYFCVCILWMLYYYYGKNCTPLHSTQCRPQGNYHGNQTLSIWMRYFLIFVWIEDTEIKYAWIICTQSSIKWHSLLAIETFLKQIQKNSWELRRQEIAEGCSSKKITKGYI